MRKLFFLSFFLEIVHMYVLVFLSAGSTAIPSFSIVVAVVVAASWPNVVVGFVPQRVARVTVAANRPVRSLWVVAAVAVAHVVEGFVATRFARVTDSSSSALVVLPMATMMMTTTTR